MVSLVSVNIYVSSGPVVTVGLAASPHPAPGRSELRLRLAERHSSFGVHLSIMNADRPNILYPRWSCISVCISSSAHKTPFIISGFYGHIYELKYDAKVLPTLFWSWEKLLCKQHLFVPLLMPFVTGEKKETKVLLQVCLLQMFTKERLPPRRNKSSGMVYFSSINMDHLLLLMPSVHITVIYKTYNKVNIT